MDMPAKRDALYETLAALADARQCRLLLEDLCTQKELDKMAERLYAARLLMEGKTYQQVIGETEISSATLSRVSRCVQYGEGYRSVLHKKPTEEHESKERRGE